MLTNIKENIHEYNNLFDNVSINFISNEQQEVPFEIKISDLLNSKTNIFIEANAGSGKTTSLQHYSKHGNENLLKMYLPLTKILKYIKYSDKLDNNSDLQIETLVDAICQYFNKLNNTNIINEKQFIEKMNENTTVLLFDGLDEVVAKFDWIFNAIQSIASSNICTTAATSRPSFINPEEINYFMKIKLLNFTTKQRIKFIKGWFSKNEELSNKLLKHIKSYKLDEIISNPFSATIFCRLAERNVPLPTTETDMYEERLRLLLGEYDEHKSINRNITYRLDLEKVASKIAFIFHKNKTRSMSFENIISRLKDENVYLEYKELEIATKELINPCNILFDEYDDGEYTFGHFRYQEYLVAKELQRNRGVNIFEYIKNNFWIGALSLFAQITDDLQYIIEDLLDKDYSLSKNQTILVEMIEKRRNKKERDSLRELVKKYTLLDFEDTFFDE